MIKKLMFSFLIAIAVISSFYIKTKINENNRTILASNNKLVYVENLDKQIKTNETLLTEIESLKKEVFTLDTSITDLNKKIDEHNVAITKYNQQIKTYNSSN